MRKYIIAHIFVIICALSVANSVNAVGIGVKPKKLNLNINAGRETKTEMLIMNTGNEPALYKIYSDELKNKIKIYPADFRLEPDGTQIVNISVKMIIPGKYATNLSIIAKPLDANGLPALSGVKIPMGITVFGYFKLAFLVFLIFCLLVIIVLKLKNNITIKLNLWTKKQN